MLPSRLRPIVRVLETVFAELYRGQRTAREATALASVALAIGRLIELGEHEERLRILEQRLSEAGAYRDRYGRQRGPIQWPATSGDD